MIYWFLGYPGIGKDYLAKMFGEVTNTLYIDGDTLLTKTEKKKLITGTFSKKDRIKKLKRISNYLYKLKKDVVITDSLPDKDSREFLLKSFKKNIVFILVKSSATKHKKQVKNRKGHFFTSKMLNNYIKNNWEPIGNFPHITLKNENKTKTELKKELLKIFK
jgi:gluconate kinase